MPQTFRVFIGSPGDVQAERDRVHALAAELNDDPLVRERDLVVEVVDWARTPHLRSAWRPPQAVIADGIPRPSACDLAVFVFHGRIGTALAPDAVDGDHRVALGFKAVPLTGSVWELCDAFRAAIAGESRGDVVVFGCQRPFSRVRGPGAERDEAKRQQAGVEALFDAFLDDEGAWRYNVIEYEDLEGFRRELNTQIRSVITRRPLRDGAGAGSSTNESGAAALPLRPPRDYLAGLAASLKRVSLLGLDARDANPRGLDAIYVPALTLPADGEEGGEVAPGVPNWMFRIVRDAGKLSALLMSRVAEQSLFLSGAAGTGKSVFCRWLCLVVASGRVPTHPVPPPEALSETFPGALAGMLPVLVPLRDFYPKVPWVADERRWSARDLEQALAGWVDRAPGGLAGATLRDFLARGRVLLVLDGFDEVPESRSAGRGIAHPRAALLTGLEDAMPGWSARGHRVLLSSRPYGLSGAEAVRLGLAEAPLKELPPPLQELFVRRWYQAVDPERDEAIATDLIAKLHAPGALQLEHVLANPMMLTALCVGYQEGRRLPRDEDELYSKVVSYVLHNRYGPDPRQVDTARRRLGVVAQAMQVGRHLRASEGEPAEDLADEPQARVSVAFVEGVLDEFASVPLAQGGESSELAARDRCEDLLGRSGLLLPAADEQAEFYHLTIQDHLAAERLYRTGASLEAWLARYAGEPAWHRCLRFWFARLARDRTLAEALAAVDVLRRELALERLAGDAAPALLLGQCLELARHVDTVPVELLGEFRRACLTASTCVDAPMARQQLFDTLAALDLDDRPGVGVGDDGLPDIEWVEVPPGTVVLEDDQGRFEVAGFRMARYPVTWAQFEAFVQTEDGYRNEAWWAGCPGDERPDGVATAAFPVANHPRDTVSWHEAVAYCRWLSASGVPARLPSEEEWQLAATGGDPARTWPWGGESGNGLAHCDDGVQSPTATAPVGLYSHGDSEHGIADLAGNVWEWTATACSGDFSQVRDPDGRASVLRGGSWLDEPAFVRSAARTWNPRDARNYGLGFRLAQDIE